MTIAKVYNFLEGWTFKTKYGEMLDELQYSNVYGSQLRWR